MQKTASGKAAQEKTARGGERAAFLHSLNFQPYTQKMPAFAYSASKILERIYKKIPGKT